MVAKKFFTNDELADLYVQASAFHYRHTRSQKNKVLARSQIIRDCPVNVHEYYEAQHHSLAILEARRFGSTPTMIVHMILTHGLQKTQKLLAETKIEIESGKSRPRSSKQKSTKLDPPQSWDNIIRALEDF